MESQKICRLLIVIFLVLTLLFCLLYKQEEMQKSVISEEFVSAAVENIESHGVTISPEVLHREIPEMDIYCFNVDVTEKYDSYLANILKTSIFGQESITTEFDTPNGTALGVYDAEGENEIGRIAFFEDDFSFSLSRKGLSMSGDDDPIMGGHISEIPETVIEKINSLCDSLTGGNKFGYSIAGCTNNESYLIVTVMQTLEGCSVNDMYLNFVFEKDDIVIISGKWITSLPVAEYHNTLTDGINILYNMDFSDVSEILGQNVVYLIRKSDNRRFLIPAWEIVYTDAKGTNRKAYFDAV